MDLTFLVSLITSQGPWGLVALLGLILGFLHQNRYYRPAMMVLIASALLLLSSVGFVVMQIIQLELHNDGDHNSAMRMSMLFGLVSSLLRALAVGLILAAVFVSRKSQD